MASVQVYPPSRLRRNTAPSAVAGERLWYQIISDGTTVTVLFQHQTVPADSPTAEWVETGTQKIWQTSDFGMNDGAMIGFAAWQPGTAEVENVKVDVHRDTNDDDVPDTWFTDLEEDFDLVSGHAESTPTHDAAGNLTYDEVTSTPTTRGIGS
jgi:hypothetical protein